MLLFRKQFNPTGFGRFIRLEKRIPSLDYSSRAAGGSTTVK
jgi:hypothetical protein